MSKAVLDTDILSEVLKGQNPNVGRREREYLEVHGHLTGTSLTVVEVVRGLHKRGASAKLKAFEERLATIEVLPLDQGSAVIAGEIFAALERSGAPIGRADPLIAAVCLRHGFSLATGNTDHFQRIVDLRFPLELHNWRLS